MAGSRHLTAVTSTTRRSSSITRHHNPSRNQEPLSPPPTPASPRHSSDLTENERCTGRLRLHLKKPDAHAHHHPSGHSPRDHHPFHFWSHTSHHGPRRYAEFVLDGGDSRDASPTGSGSLDGGEEKMEKLESPVVAKSRAFLGKLRLHRRVTMENWSYNGDLGPRHWDRIPGLQIGTHQSPVEFVNDDLLFTREEFVPDLHYFSPANTTPSRTSSATSLASGSSGLTPRSSTLAAPSPTKKGAFLFFSFDDHRHREHGASVAPEEPPVSASSETHISLGVGCETCTSDGPEDCQVKNTGRTVQIVIPGRADQSQRSSTPRLKAEAGAAVAAHLRGGGHGGWIDFDGMRYHLVQIHFHAPSEHLVPGKHFDMEAHLVHQSEDGHLLVIGMFMKAAERSPEPIPHEEVCTFLDCLDHHIPGSRKNKLQHVDHLPLEQAAELIRSSPSYYVYQGSLTTPPLKEGVVWIVCSKTYWFRSALIAAIQTAMPFHNVRPAVRSDLGYETPLKHEK
ncbi:hypothetical protein HDU96_002041 [Phlyctochytrium bullatum]|nr:hypothetical protein HDU96_002041 [Phlyctochytrium bullatum]